MCPSWGIVLLPWTTGNNSALTIEVSILSAALEQCLQRKYDEVCNKSLFIATNH